DGRRRPDRPSRPPRHHDHAQGQELPAPRTRPRHHARRTDALAARPALTSKTGQANTCAVGSQPVRAAPTPSISQPIADKPSERAQWCTFRLPKPAHYSTALDTSFSGLCSPLRGARVYVALVGGMITLAYLARNR